MPFWNCFTCSNVENEESSFLRITRLQQSDEEQKEALELMWDRKIFIGSRECRVRDLISDPLEPEKCPELELKMAQAEYVRMFVQKGTEDYDDKEYLTRKFSAISAFHVSSKEQQERTNFWFKKWSDARAKLQATEEHLAALDREIKLVERQKARVELEQARPCPSTAAKRGKCCCKLRASFNVFKKRKQ